MAFDALRSTLRRTMAATGSPDGFDDVAPIPADPTVDGGTDAVVFSCPTCGRTIPHGVGRCDGCGQRLLLDMPFGRASSLALGGVAAGVISTLLLVNLFAPPAPPVATADQQLNGAGGSGGVTGSLAVPAGAASALRGTSAINGRLAAQAEPLAAALAAKSFSTGDVVKVLRRMSIDTRAGAGMVKALDTWPEAAGQQAALAAFYKDLTSHIDTGLASSVRSGSAYRQAAKTILVTLGQVPGLDADARTLASQVGLELVPITIPKALR